MLKKKRKNLRSKGVILILVVILLGLCLGLIFSNREIKEGKASIDNEDVTKSVDLEKVKASFNNYVTANEGAKLYINSNDEYVEVSTLFGSIELELDASYEIVDEYFKVINSEFYIRYDEVNKIETLTPKEMEYKYYKNYIPYNENVILNNGSELYVNDVSYYLVNEGSYPIIISDTERYGIEYNNSLVYVNKSFVKEVVSSNNTNLEYTDEISVLNYHFVVGDGTNEESECKQIICITDTMFDSHIKYLHDNGYYGVSMRDLELFIDGKIRLPKKSVSITIDDGWYVARSITILEKYQILGTLFLVGSLASPDAYRSSYLEIHSHTWNMHGLKTGDDCPNSSFRGGITCFDDNTILNDLRQSRESLNNTTYFCYPFYDYNNKAIELLKKAGFTMAFAGQLGNNTVRVGQDKYRIPRYVIYSYTTMEQFIRYVG